MQTVTFDNAELEKACQCFKFEPFEQVITRNDPSNERYWVPGIFHRVNKVTTYVEGASGLTAKVNSYYETIGERNWQYCLPYKWFKHLIDTVDVEILHLPIGNEYTIGTGSSAVTGKKLPIGAMVKRTAANNAKNECVFLNYFSQNDFHWLVYDTVLKEIRQCKEIEL